MSKKLSKPQESDNQKQMESKSGHGRQDFPHVDLFALTVNTKLATFMSPIPETAAWKVDSLVQSWGL